MAAAKLSHFPLAGESTAHRDAGDVINQVLSFNRKWAQGFTQPKALGVKRKLAVVTCMDSRLLPEDFLGLSIGDAEIIRNGGGRVTPDVIRSMVICQDLLGCDILFVLHHTDCGGQAAARYHDEVMTTLDHHFNTNASFPVKVMWQSGWVLSSFVPAFLRSMLTKAILRPINDLYASVVEDVQLLRRSPTIKPTTKVYGGVYSVDTGKIEMLCADLGDGLKFTDEYTAAQKSGDSSKTGSTGKSSDGQPAGS